MAKYDVKFACGHTQTMELFGVVNDRYAMIEWYEKNGLCAECYADMKKQDLLAKCDLVEMPYSTYKNEYANCKSERGSYRADKKTIMVYVPKNKEE